MHVFTFSDSDADKQRFEIVYRGLIIMGNTNTQKGLSVLTRELALLDKLEAISHPCDCGRLVPGTKEPDRELTTGADPRSLVIDDQEFDLLYQYVSGVPWSIGTSSRGAIQALLWLRNGRGAG
jgi:hypothetical protein